jgi:uncharacterized membrane protein
MFAALTPFGSGERAKPILSRTGARDARPKTQRTREQTAMQNDSQNPINSLRESIGKTMQALATACFVLALFVVLLVLSALLALARLLPYVLRALSILAWAVSLFLVFVAVSTLYARFSDPIAAMMTAGLFTLIVAIAPIAFNKLGGDAIFGGYLLAALLGLGVKWLCENATPDQYATASVIPPTLAAMCLIVVAIQQKERKEEND